MLHSAHFKCRLSLLMYRQSLAEESGQHRIHQPEAQEAAMQISALQQQDSDAMQPGLTVASGAQNPVVDSASTNRQTSDDVVQATAAPAQPSIADIIRRFDSGNAQGIFQQKRHAKGHSQDSFEPAQQSPRISALRARHQEEEEQRSMLATESGLHSDFLGPEPLESASGESPVHEGRSMQSQPDLGQASVQKGSLMQPQLTGQGSMVPSKLRGQGSSMRGDLWLPQQWLEPAEQLQRVPSPRDRMHAAMEAVRAAERAVEAAKSLSPSR